MAVPPDKEVSFLESVNLSFDAALATLDIPEGTVSYTHLTLPTKRIV